MRSVYLDNVKQPEQTTLSGSESSSTASSITCQSFTNSERTSVICEPWMDIFADADYRVDENLKITRCVEETIYYDVYGPPTLRLQVAYLI
jgi:hypothetical protein